MANTYIILLGGIIIIILVVMFGLSSTIELPSRPTSKGQSRMHTSSRRATVRDLTGRFLYSMTRTRLMTISSSQAQEVLQEHQQGRQQDLSTSQMKMSSGQVKSAALTANWRPTSRRKRE
jgi:hypothetical protein